MSWRVSLQTGVDQPRAWACSESRLGPRQGGFFSLGGRAEGHFPAAQSVWMRQPPPPCLPRRPAWPPFPVSSPPILPATPSSHPLFFLFPAGTIPEVFKILKAVQSGGPVQVTISETALIEAQGLRTTPTPPNSGHRCLYYKTLRNPLKELAGWLNSEHFFLSNWAVPNFTTGNWCHGFFYLCQPEQEA